jgi:hypothetical protein
MTVHFGYDKKQVLQALRYHFLSRKEIRFMIILINVFALLVSALFYFKKIVPTLFFTVTFMWIVLMLSFWFVLPGLCTAGPLPSRISSPWTLKKMAFRWATKEADAGGVGKP